jgi:hypothetical protein
MSYQQWAMLLHRRTFKDLLRQRRTHAAISFYALVFCIGLVFAAIHAIQAHQPGYLVGFSGAGLIMASLAIQQLTLYRRVKLFLAQATSNATESKLLRLACLADHSATPRVEALHQAIDRWSDEQQRLTEWDESHD